MMNMIAMMVITMNRMMKMTWFRNTFSMSSSSRLHLLMFSSSCLEVTIINQAD